MNLGNVIGHDFIVNNHGELSCSDTSQVRAEHVTLDFSSGDMMGWVESLPDAEGALLEINLCEGCFEGIIKALIRENERLKSKKCAHDLAGELLAGE